MVTLRKLNGYKKTLYMNISDVSKDISILTKVFETLPIGIGVFYIENHNDFKSIRYYFMNDTILKEMNRQRDIVIGKRIWDIAPEAYTDSTGLKVIQSYFKVAKMQESISLGRIAYRNTEVSGIYDCSIHPINKNYIYVKLINESEKIKSEIDLINTKKMASIGMLLSGIAHEINNPLNYISGSLDILSKEYDNIVDRKKAKTAIRYAKIGIKKITSLVKQLQILDKKTTKQTEKCCINKAINSAIKVNFYRITNIVTLHNKKCKEKIKIEANKTDLHHIFINIISNALDAMENVDRRSVLKISCKVKDNYFSISIKDNGCGIKPEDLENVKDPFFTSKEPGKGIGLGLTIADRYVRNYNGKLDITSKYGVGSNVTISFPIKNNMVIPKS